MKKNLLALSLLALPVLGFSQIFQEDFDGNGPGISAWTVIDVDGKTPAPAVAFITNGWNVLDKQGADGNFGGPPGDHAAMSTSWYSPAGTSNDWLISPKISLPAASVLKWEAKAQDPDYSDGYKVMLSTNGGNTVADFTVTLLTVPAEDSVETGQPWKSRSIDLTAYAGQNVRIAFVNNSNDMFMLLVDNIKVESSTPATNAPNCATLTAPTNGNQAVPANPPASLKWTAATTGDAASSYDVYFGTTPNPTTLLGNYTATSATTSTLAPLTTYYWKVVPKNSIGAATGCSEFSFKTLDANPPGCVTNVTPADGATGVPGGTTPISWVAPTTGGAPVSYDVYWGKDTATLAKLGNTVNTAVNITNTSYDTTYYWKVVAVNTDGTSAASCPTYKLTTGSNPYAPYCGPLAYTYIEPITKVTFANLTNASSADETSPAHEIFLDKVATVTKGESYTMTLEGFTGGNYKNRFVVFADWNKDGTFDPTTETYVVSGVLENSTGADGKTVTVSIPVPADAATGDTRLRIKKTFGANPYVDPCVTGTGFGQAEDYTLKINSATPPVTYCEVKINCTDGDLITNVTFAGINNDSDCGTNGYSDYSASVAPANVQPGQVYPMSVTVGDGWYEKVSAWIDYNNNGVFEASEYLGQIGEGGTGVVTSADITIPATAAAGTYRLRILVNAAGSTGEVSQNPCLFEDPVVIYGEYEDYSVKVGTLAVSDVNKAKVQVFPNPVIDVLKINSTSNAKSIKIFDMNGKLVTNQAAKNTANEVNMSRMTPGAYVVVVETEKGSETIKVIKK